VDINILGKVSCRLISLMLQVSLYHSLSFTLLLMLSVFFMLPFILMGFSSFSDLCIVCAIGFVVSLCGIVVSAIQFCGIYLYVIVIYIYIYVCVCVDEHT